MMEEASSRWEDKYEVDMSASLGKAREVQSRLGTLVSRGNG